MDLAGDKIEVVDGKVKQTNVGKILFDDRTPRQCSNTGRWKAEGDVA